MASAEHPLIAAHGAHAAPDLVGEGLKSECAVCGGERAGDSFIGAVGRLSCEKDIDGFVKAAAQERDVAGERNRGTGHRLPWPVFGLGSEVKAMQRVEEEFGADAAIEIVAAPPESVESVAFAQHFFDGKAVGDHV